MIKTISNDQHIIISNIINLHLGGKDIECDPTYGRGNFYKDSRVKKPKYIFDINPIKGVPVASADNLPIADGTLESIMFDPPFLATKGPSLNVKDKSNQVTKRFGCFDTERELHKFYIDCLNEFHRVLKNTGVLIFKCQDKVSSGKQYYTHCFILEQANKIGFYAKDMFVLIAKNRMIPKWQTKNQKHARKFHSYFWVFEKTTNHTVYV